MLAIETEGLRKTYTVGFWRKQERVALKPLHLRVEAGEIFGYLGANGAGKTTTLKLLMGLIFPDGGAVRLLGADFRDPAVKARVGFLPEQPYFYDYLSAPELLEYYGQLSGVPARETRRRIPQVLERVGLADVGKLHLRKFSKGMLQRVGIAQAILHNPQLVVLDEPMSGLDPLGRREVRELIRSLKQEGKTIFFSTHILSDAEALCDRVAIIHLGELRGVGTIGELTAGIAPLVEVIWQGGEGAAAALERMGARLSVTGNTSTATLAVEKLDGALDSVRHAQGRLVSVTPLRASLEDYFMQRLNAAPPRGEEAAGVEKARQGVGR